MLPFQVRFLNEAYAQDKNGMWKYSIVAENAPRQNSKTKKLNPLILYDLYVLHYDIFVSAHEISAVHKIWADLYDTINRNEELKAELGKYNSTAGKEFLSLKTGGQVVFRSRRNSAAGMGGTFDVVILDEAQELKADYNNMVKETMKTKKNSQIIYMGTPFLPNSTGDYFDKLLDSAKDNDSIFAVRYGIDDENADVEDKKLWKLTNPLYPDVIPDSAFEQHVSDAKQQGEAGLMDMRIQDLGLWWKDKIPPAISSGLWNASALEVKTDPDTTVCSIVYDQTTGRLAVAVAQYSASDVVDGRECANHEFVTGEILGERPQHESWQWISDLLGSSPRDTIVIVDAGGLTKPIENMLPDNLYPVRLSGAEFLASQQGFVDALNNGRFKHTNQPELMAEVKNLQKVPSGESWKFAPIDKSKSIAGLKALAEAVWYRTVNQEDDSEPPVVYL